MWLFNRLMFSLMVFFLLASCTPVYKTHYSYVLPQNPIGKKCAMQCSTAKTYCQQLCELRKKNCRIEARKDAREKFQEYQYEQTYAGKRGKRNAAGFDRSFVCNRTCECRPAFNTCYSACGGAVLEKKECISNCGN